MKKYKRNIIIFLCFLITTSMFSACEPKTRRIPPADNNLSPNNTVGSNLVERISASYERADMSFAKVIPKTLDIRSGPGSDFPIIGNASSGNKLNVYGKADDWYIVKLPNKNSIGCVEGKCLEPYSPDQNTKPIPNVPPAPVKPNTPGIPNDVKAPGGSVIIGPDNKDDSQTPPPKVPRPETPNNTTETGPEQTGSKTNVMTSEERKILELCNSERSKVKAPALKENNDLTKLARLKSRDIVDNNYFSHQSPTYGSPFDMMREHGINYMYAGENLAQNTSAERAFQAWMNSESHKKNILNPNFTELGVGIVSNGNRGFTYTQMFIGK